MRHERVQSRPETVLAIYGWTPFQVKSVSPVS